MDCTNRQVNMQPPPPCETRGDKGCENVKLCNSGQACPEFWFHCEKAGSTLSTGLHALGKRIEHMTLVEYHTPTERCHKSIYGELR